MTKKSIISIVLIWSLITLVIITLAMGHENWFSIIFFAIQLLGIGLIILNSLKNKKMLLGLLIVFFSGMIIEYIGVNYEFIFGEYEYGDGMGIKFFGVPIMVCVNWAAITYCTSAIAEKISTNKIIISILGALLFVALDIVVEATAQRFDLFWQLSNFLPINEYIEWIIASFIAHFLFIKVAKKGFNYTLAFNLFTSIFVLQIVLIYFTNTFL
ncbi:carotenoid biosynthesis protein [Aquimarina sp. 2201CG1-2-11]|uniref:carotenoid biosynthesis protein n=1 Tax=Aquimarina discodermiae TaxID=3231043 RepID=UPI0034622C17